ncbi:MAG: DUF1499 domain-containing protein [Pseudomonadota bacterium]
MKRSFQRVSHRARWARRFALVALPVAAIAIFGQRLGSADTPTTLITYAVGVLIALAALGLGVSALPSIIGDRYRGGRDAVIAILLGMIVLVPVFYAGYRFFERPLLSDITTAPTAPPPFDAALAARPEGANDLTYPRANADLQRNAYPAVRPLFANIAPEDVFAVAEGIVEANGWQILDVVQPTPGFTGRIEAVATTQIFGFKDDVLIVVTGTADGARVDMRSASRFARHDLGANADRIDRFLDELADQLVALSTAIIEAPEDAETEEPAQ